jgi:hypothetical protein
MRRTLRIKSMSCAVCRGKNLMIPHLLIIPAGLNSYWRQSSEWNLAYDRRLHDFVDDFTENIEIINHYLVKDLIVEDPILSGDYRRTLSQHNASQMKCSPGLTTVTYLKITLQIWVHPYVVLTLVLDATAAPHIGRFTCPTSDAMRARWSVLQMTTVTYLKITL